MGLQIITSKQFFALLSAVLSLALLSSGVVTWVAANWQSIESNHKILLVQGILLLIAVSLVLLRRRSSSDERQIITANYWWYQGLAFFGAVVSGALIALVGQVYQTGADTWQLFAFWFLLILPWFAFSPNVFIAALAVVVANTAVVLFLMDNQLLIPRTTITYLLAFLNALLFVALEHKWARHDSLWAVLSTTVLICTMAIFSSAGIETFPGAISLHLLIAAVLLMFYVRLIGGELHIKVLIVATLASAFSLYIGETASDVFWRGDRLSSMFLTIALIWGAAAFVIFSLWRAHSKSTRRSDAETKAVSQALPTSINVFLALSSILVAAFLFSFYYVIAYQNYEFQIVSVKQELAIFLLLAGLVGLYVVKAGAVAYVFLLSYEIAVFMGIESGISNYYDQAYMVLDASIPVSMYVGVVVGLVTSVLIYRKRSEAWIGFIASLGFFTFLTILPYPDYMAWLMSEVMLLPLIFIALMWWFFKSSDKLSLPLFSAFILWACYVVATSLYRTYSLLYTYNDFGISFKSILLAFIKPFMHLADFSELPITTAIISFVYWIIWSLFSLIPLWALLQIAKNKGVATKTVAVLMGLLVAWLWYGRIEIVIALGLMVLAYHHRNRALYYAAVVLGLVSLSMFYFSLHMPLVQKAYLLLLSGALFLLLYFIFAKRLLVDGEEATLGGESFTSQLATAADGLKTRIAPVSQAGFYGLLALALLLPIAVSQWQVHSYDRILGSGQRVLLRLQPVDPRSLMQGDYMVINYELSGRVYRELQLSISDETGGSQITEGLKSRLSLEEGVRFLAEVQVVDGVAEQPIAFYDRHEVIDFHSREDVVYLPFVMKREGSRYIVSPSFSETFFFSEDAAEAFEQARFAELAVGQGRVMLKGLLDIDRDPISAATNE